MAIIGILGTPYNVIERSPFWWNKVSYTRQSFIDVFQDLGHTAIILPVDQPENAEKYMKLVDKIVLTGGADIAPRFYHEEPHQKLETTDPSRDAFELAAVKAAINENKAILGVCRGLQLLNVYFGGTLYQDLSQTSSDIKHRQSPTPQEIPTHHVTIKKNSSLGFLPEEYLVNSFHHQVIKDLGQDLTAIAHATDGFVEAIENTNKRILAVQWHPECTWQTEHFDKEIFRYFAEEL
ncbi:gamma-glutamyl-gamma-aminobutyrate hydrolase family protein [Lactococcus protaetiae]|uniref:Gamma-glutamyl-gamma-aminobutyrate hydrolase family protein n=1 Tax=Lactococcus protaetiae TaxID=2592653 RepID=A0A514Z5X8_9LACT|nr:gamma-glutamyl-gamma-aminobutyrate hydrolase family protein [Lactococcus protaetiae]MCL2113006.1 gamma-glutamyl-gamma-aminobutyrate hydrolase family protein [Streptococcaceae bacterium]QDK69979.1 gamma-glutamyl-gamma-aminobutyrate hydrolase family protein [Lactococcus protaetiae]